MASSDEFVCHRSVRPLDMLLGLVTSILLHSILLIGSKYWHIALMREPKQKITQEIPIEVVEVPPNKTDIPPKTSPWATKNSIAGGKALSERPVSVVKSVNPVGHKSESSFDLAASSPLKVFHPEREQQKTKSPNLSPQQPQFKPQKILSTSAREVQVPNSQKIAVAPVTTPLPDPLLKTAPNPKPIPSAPATAAQVPNSKKLVVAPVTTPVPLLKTAPLTTPLVLKPKQISSAPATAAQVSNSKKLVVAPVTTPSPVPLLKTAPLTTPLVLKPKQISSVPATAAQVSNSKKLVVAPVTTPVPLLKTAPLTTPLVLKPRQISSAPATAVQVPNSKKITVAPAPYLKTAFGRTATLPIPSNPKNLGQSITRLSRRTTSQGQSSLKTGAASLLGGTMSVSSQNYHGDELAALPNSNRDRQGTSGIDARSQDIDLTSYLNKLKQRVQQHWLPGISQSNRRTVLNFTINRSGQVSNLSIAQTSGFSVTDEVALNAIQRATPFAPLPTGYSKNHINIEFTFDINVYGELNVSGDGG
ncbi:TonB family protein [Nostoc sp. KVJ3]|uniref:energy transducer TonB n=1 Tax=Nostoc sp. KVJ3 TaxID=457945 RepID=UPI002237E633|nr:TonB family protein [Nostoc sp. KVJ3]MCW5313511.1 TonB family protein [Nostoc sp. KVJ3]